MKTFGQYIEQFEDEEFKGDFEGVEDEDGESLLYGMGNRKEWRHKGTGQLHKKRGPAVIWDDGTEEYFIYNNQHRIDGPAVDGPNMKAYYIHGRLHKEDGPALSRKKNGKWEYKWYMDGKSVFDMEEIPDWYQEEIMKQDMKTFVQLAKKGKIDIPQADHINDLTDIGAI